MGFFAALTAIPAILNGASGMVKGFTDLATARVQAAANTEQAKIKSGEAVELKQEETFGILAQLQHALWLADQKWWVTRWIRPGFAYLSMLHYGAVIFASMGWIKGPVHALPAPMDWLEIGIIGTYFLLRPLEKRRTVEPSKK